MSLPRNIKVTKTTWKCEVLGLNPQIIFKPSTPAAKWEAAIRRTPKAMGQLGWWCPQWENTQRPYYRQDGWQGLTWQTLLTSTHVLWYIHVHIHTHTHIVNTHAYNKYNSKNNFLVASSTTHWTCFPPPQDSDVSIVETAEATKNLVLRIQVEGTWFAWPLYWSVPRLFSIYIYVQKPCWVISSLFYKRFQ